MLAPFFCVQPSMWLGLLLKGHTAELVHIGSPGPLLQSCFPVGSQLVLLDVVTLPLEFMRFFSANSYSLLRSLQKAILPCSVLINLSSLVSSTNLLRAHSILFFLKM